MKLFNTYLIYGQPADNNSNNLNRKPYQKKPRKSGVIFHI